MWKRDRDLLEKALADLRKRSATKRQQAVEVLGQSLDARAIRPLIRMLGDADERVRDVAITALSRFGSEVVDPLIHDIEDGDLTFQENALDLLKRINDERTIPVCIELLSTPHHHLRAQAAEILKTFGTIAIQALWDALDHVKYNVRSEALDLLAAMPEEQAATCILNALNHPSSYVREKAADIFLHQGDRAIESLSQLLADQNALAASTVLDILDRIGGVQPMYLLEKALSYPQWQVREKAVKVLGNLQNPTAIDLLASCLHDPEKYIRQRVVDELGKHGGKNVVEPLIAALSDNVKAIQQSALRHLGTIGDVRSVEPMMAFLRNPDPALRKEAASALQKIRDARAIPVFLPLLTEENSFIREQAGQLLHPLFALIETVVFGSLPLESLDPRTTLWNLETVNLTMMMPALSTIIIQADTYDFYQVERFLTYVVNYLGQDYVKHQVKVHLYGHPYSLHPNLRNNLEHLFERVEIQGGEG
jgi:HEAT repeat protein